MGAGGLSPRQPPHFNQCLKEFRLLWDRKSVFSPHRGDSLHRFTWSFARPSVIDTCIRLAVRNLTSSVHRGGHWNWKVPLFDKYSHRRGEPFDQFLQILEAYIGPSTLQKWCKFEVKFRFTGYEVITEVPRVSHLPRIYIFSVHPVWKTMRWIENWLTPATTDSTSSTTMQSSWRSSYAPRLWVRKYAVCMFIFCLSHSEAGALFVRGGILPYFEICVTVLWRFWFCFHHYYFGRDCPFRRS